MKTISRLTLPNGLDIEILFDNGKLAYTFTHEGKAYGSAVRLPSKSVIDITTASLLLFTNAVETYQELTK